MALKQREEFRREAVRIALSSSLSRTRVTADQGIGKSTLSHWISQYRSTDLTVSEASNERLHQENRVLREEREISKKATQFFASQKT